MSGNSQIKNPYEENQSLSKKISKHRGWGRPDIFHMRGSVIVAIIPIVFFSTAISTIVTVLIKSNRFLVGSVAVVVGLLLAFRTNNAYDSTQIRNVSRLTWIGIREFKNPQDHNEKVAIIKMLLAFAVAVKHHLRLEFGTEWFDLEDLLPDGFQLAAFDGNAGQENTDLGGGGSEDHRDDPNHPDNRDLPPSEAPTIVVHNDNHHHQGLPHTKAAIRSLAGSWSQTSIYFNNGKLKDNCNLDASMSLPLEIVFHLGAYYDRQVLDNKDPNNPKITGAAFGAISGSLNTLIDILGSLERIGNTPIPFAYRIHLKQAVTIYVWVLPFTLVSTLYWLTIPVVMMIAFILFGVEAIGSEIENPFGYDRNDLPLDEYCKDLEAEIKYLQKFLPSNSTKIKKTI
ncbi:6790_t:CDS:2 [Entrophospora sp. SA101]|nr:6790_t:CDS:2 [Entrophospora sp. SA101]